MKNFPSAISVFHFQIILDFEVNAIFIRYCHMGLLHRQQHYRLRPGYSFRTFVAGSSHGMKQTHYIFLFSRLYYRIFIDT